MCSSSSLGTASDFLVLLLFMLYLALWVTLLSLFLNGTGILCSGVCLQIFVLWLCVILLQLTASFWLEVAPCGNVALICKLKLVLSRNEFLTEILFSSEAALHCCVVPNFLALVFTLQYFSTLVLSPVVQLWVFPTCDTFCGAVA